jgi:hypothetical protein
VAALTLALTLLLPSHGVLVQGKSLGGVMLGMTPAQVQSRWGTDRSRCRGCAQATWYYNYHPFRPEGAAVRFRRGRVDSVWTLWQPPGWTTRDGLRLGSSISEVNVRYGALVTIPCGSYSALILTKGRVTTVYYVYDDKLWGFGLTRPGTTPCR